MRCSRMDPSDVRSIETSNLKRSPDELFGFAPQCRLPCQKDANKNRLAAAAVGFRAFCRSVLRRRRMALSSVRHAGHVAIPSSCPRMAVHNCRPSSTRFVAIWFEAFGMASLIFSMGYRTKLPFRKWRQINHYRERRMTCRVISAPEGS